MPVLLKFEKTGAAAYLPHLDMLRSFNRTLRRADITVKFSEGFNPHQLLFFGPPLSLGQVSRCEYVFIDTDMPAAELFDRYNRNAPEGLNALKSADTDKNPNIAAIAKRCNYLLNIDLPNGAERVLEALEKTGVINVETKRNGVVITEDLRPKIYGAKKISAGQAELMCACGNYNLRIDKLCGFLATALKTDLAAFSVERTVLFAEKNGKYIDFDELFCFLKR